MGFRVRWRRVGVGLGVLVIVASLLLSPQATAVGPVGPTDEPGDIAVSGVVYDARLGPSHAIVGATVSVCTSVPRCFPATTGGDGDYSLLIPALYAGR